MEPNNNQSTDELEIDLKQLVFILLDKLWIILLAAIAIGLAAFIFSRFMIDPIYESTSKVYILNRQDASTTTLSDIQSSTQLTKDYQILIKSRPVTEQVISGLDLNLTAEALSEMITVNSPVDTRILEITVSNTDPYMAKNIVDELTEVSSVRIAEVMDIEKVNVAEDGNLPTAPVSPSIMKNTAIGAVLGMVLACAVILLIFILDDSIKDESDIEKYLNLSVLGSIPMAEEESKGRKKDKKKDGKKGR